MKRRAWMQCCYRWLLVFVVLGVGAACSEQSESDSMVGKVMPALELVALDGSPVPLSAFKGRVLVLNFWATWCAPCREEMPDLQRLSDHLDPTGFAVAGVSVDQDLNLVREFLLKTQVRFQQFSDRDMSLSSDVLQIQAFPETLIIGRDGRLLRRISGAKAWMSPEFVDYLQSLQVREPQD